jgi:hypothetical protein
MLTAALLTIVVAAAVGVCGWVDMLGDRLWLVAGAGAAMVALFGVQAMLPNPVPSAERSFPIYFVGTFVVALALNIIALFVGRAVKRRQVSGNPPQQH